MAKRPRKTAEELMRELEADPQWVAKRAARDARHADRVAHCRADEAPVVAELAAAGVPVSSVGDFVGKRVAPLAAIPVLVRHLGEAHIPAVRESLIRALGVPAARATAFEPLCAAYRVERDPNMRFVIANALSGMARFDEVADLPGIDEHLALFPKPRRSGQE